MNQELNGKSDDEPTDDTIEDIEFTEDEEETCDEEDDEVEEEYTNGMDPNSLLDEKCFRYDAGSILNLIASCKLGTTDVHTRRWLVDQLLRKALNNDAAAYQKFTSNSTCEWDESKGRYKSVKWNPGKKPQHVITLSTDYSTWVLPCECKDNSTKHSSTWKKTQSSLEFMDDIRKTTMAHGQRNIDHDVKQDEKDEKKEDEREIESHDTDGHVSKRARIERNTEQNSNDDTFSFSALSKPDRDRKQQNAVSSLLCDETVCCLGIRQTILSQCADAFDDNELKRILREIVKSILTDTQYPKWCSEYQRLHGIAWD